MAELSKIFKSNELYEAWRNEKEIPSNVLAVVLDKDNNVNKVAFGTNDITGEYETYEVAKGEPKEYASNDNVYVVNNGIDTNPQGFMKKNISSEFDYPEKKGDVFVKPFRFSLISINYPVDIENVKIYFCDRNSTPSGTQWINITENVSPIQYTLLDNGSYSCTVEFNDNVDYGQNFIIAYTLPSSSTTQVVDDYMIAYWKNGVGQ